MQYVRDYDEVHRIWCELDDATRAGALTPEILSRAVDAIDEAGYETIPLSIGMSWIWQHPKEFAEVVGDIPGFFRAHMDNSEIAKVISSAELLKSIPEEDREPFVREIIAKHNPGRYWVYPVSSVGVSREAQAEMILGKLRNCEVDPSRGVWNFLQHEFIEYGAGRVDGVIELATRNLRGGRFMDTFTLWSVLADDQLVEALHICIAKAPNLIFGGRHPNEFVTLIQKLQLRLTPEQVANILKDAASALESMNGVSLDEFGRLPFDEQLAVARRLGGGSLDLVVRLALQLGYQNGGTELCKEFIGQFSSGSSPAAYRRLWWPSLDTANDQQMAMYIEQMLRRRLEEDGFILAQVKESTYCDRRTQRVLIQGVVTHNGITYVRDRNQHRYFPQAGDWVIVDPKRGRRLTPTVVAAIFIPARSNGVYM